MVKENKILKYNLESEVDAMLDSGMSLEQVATTIKNSHSDIIDLQNLSSMSIMRYRNSRDKSKMVEEIGEGKDPVDIFVREFNTRMKALDKKTDTLYNKCVNLLNKLEKEDNSELILKAIRETTNNIDQSRKNWTSLAQYGIRQTSNIYNINMKKEQNIKIMLLEWARDLCPVCREKIFNVFEEISQTKDKETSQEIIKEENVNA